ncbi:MAG TPA: response regulator [Flavisolibacter sp.]|nr:response regulator [Flavisolibacter sp.]
MKDNLKLLIVDDDADDRNFFIESVKEIDDTIACEVAKDGLQALEILNDAERPLPDFIFLDLRMPRFNGKKCLTEIKSSDRLKGIPVIIYTTSTEVDEAYEVKRLGAVRFISKPHSPEEIYYILSVVLEEEMPNLGKKL